MTTIHALFAVVETAKSLLLKKFLEISHPVSTTMVTLALVGRQPFVRAYAEHALPVAILTMTKNTIAAKTTDPDEASAPTADVSNHFYYATFVESNMISGDRYERSTYSSSRSPSPRPRRRKSLGEEALGAIGGALGIKAARDRSRDRDRDSDRGRSRKYRSHSDSRSRSRGHRAKSEARIAQAMKAALAAGAAEAFRVRSTPGPWTGEKGRRVLTAAVSAGGVDGLIDRDPNKHGGRHVLESILAGMATNHLVNGSRSKSRSRNGTRERSQSRGGVRDMAAAGILAAAGKQVYDRFSQSRGRDRSDSRDSRDGGRDSKKRGSSVSRALNKGLAALGLDDKNQSDRGRDRSTRSSDYSDSEDDRSYRSSRRRRSSRDVRSQRNSSVSGSTSRAVAQKDGSSNGNVECHSDCDSDSDISINSDDEKREKKKMLRKELVTSGLATVATIHAAHNVMKNLEAQKKRHEAVKSGAISKEQERTMQRKADLKNLASIGLAALGIKGAIGEWKEVQEQRKEHKEFNHKCEERHQKRLRRAQSAGGSNRNSQGSRSRAASAASMSMNTGHDYGRDYGHNYGHDYGHHASHYYDGNPYGAGDISIDV